MRLENAVASEVLTRILSAYGFTMQKDLSDHLGIAKSNVASWLQRGHVPGNVIVQCALDTGTDVQWLVTGELEKARIMGEKPKLNGKKLYEEIMSNGGRAVLQRIMDAYGFSTQKQLCDLLEISSGTVSTWIRRNYFPGDVVVTCALETGVPLLWLATGAKDQRKNSEIHNATVIPKIDINTGELVDSGEFVIDNFFFTKNNRNADKVKCVLKNNNIWLIDYSEVSLGNGTWLISIDGIHDIWNVVRLPGGNIKLSNDLLEFTCQKSDINCVGRVVLKIQDF